MARQPCDPEEAVQAVAERMATTVPDAVSVSSEPIDMESLKQSSQKPALPGGHA